MSKLLGTLGTLATVIYVFVILYLRPTLFYDLSLLPLDSFADVLGGVFGPIAIFWLVLGFFQQGEELRHSVETLRLQAEELRNSVEQQKGLVSVTKQQLAIQQAETEANERKRKFAIQPRPTLYVAGSEVGIGALRYRLNITNGGHSATFMELKVFQNDLEVGGIDMDYFPNSASNPVDLFHGNALLRLDQALRIDISYIDMDGERMSSSFLAAPPKEDEDATKKFSITPIMQYGHNDKET